MRGLNVWIFVIYGECGFIKANLRVEVQSADTVSYTHLTLPTTPYV